MSERTVDESAVRELRADNAGLGLVECGPTVGDADRPARASVVCREQLIFRACGIERVPRALRRVLDELEQPVQLEQLCVRLLLELTPADERLLCQLDELHLRIGKPKDPRPPVTRATRMAEAKLLDEQDVAALTRERTGSRSSHDPSPDDHDFGTHGPILVSAQRECDFHAQLRITLRVAELEKGEGQDGPSPRAYLSSAPNVP